MKRRPEIRLRSQARDLFILSTFGAGGGGLFKRWGSFGLAKVMVSVFHKKKKKRKLKLEKLKYMKLKLI